MQAARGFTVPVFVELENGTTISKPVQFRAGVWIIDYDPTLPDEVNP